MHCVLSDLPQWLRAWTHHEKFWFSSVQMSYERRATLAYFAQQTRCKKPWTINFVKFSHLLHTFKRANIRLRGTKDEGFPDLCYLKVILKWNPSLAVADLTPQIKNIIEKWAASTLDHRPVSPKTHGTKWNGFQSTRTVGGLTDKCFWLRILDSTVATDCLIHDSKEYSQICPTWLLAPKTGDKVRAMLADRVSATLQLNFLIVIT